MSIFQRIAAAVNSVVQPLLRSPRWGRLVENRMTVITYTGRRAGRTFERRGKATAIRDARGQVRVNIALDPAA